MAEWEVNMGRRILFPTLELREPDPNAPKVDWGKIQETLQERFDSIQEHWDRILLTGLDIPMTQGAEIEGSVSVTLDEDGFVTVRIPGDPPREYRTNSPDHPHPLLPEELGVTLRAYSKSSFDAEKAHVVETRAERKKNAESEAARKALPRDFLTALSNIATEFQGRGLSEKEMGELAMRVFHVDLNALVKTREESAYNRGFENGTLGESPLGMK